MATYESLRQAIDTLIKTNGNEEITGAILNNVLNAMITALGANYQFCGEATPSTNPGQPMQNVFYFAYDAGTYVNFGNITLPMGISTLSWNGTQWTGDTIYQIDSTPILNSTKLITSGAVFNAISSVYTSIGFGKVFAGIAVPSTTPEPINGVRMFYIATQAGTYSHFFANYDIPLVLPHDGLYVIYSTTEDDDWNWEEIVGFDDVPTSGSDNLVRSGGVFNELALGAVYDVSAKNPTAGPNNDGKFASLSALLNDANLNTLIPVAFRKGGMSIKFVQSSDNKYVQYRLMNTEWSTVESNWQRDNVLNNTFIINFPKFTISFPSTNKMAFDANPQLCYNGKRLKVFAASDAVEGVFTLDTTSGANAIAYVSTSYLNSLAANAEIGLANITVQNWTTDMNLKDKVVLCQSTPAIYTSTGGYSPEVGVFAPYIMEYSLQQLVNNRGQIVLNNAFIINFPKFTISFPSTNKMAFDANPQLCYNGKKLKVFAASDAVEGVFTLDTTSGANAIAYISTSYLNSLADNAEIGLANITVQNWTLDMNLKDKVVLCQSTPSVFRATSGYSPEVGVFAPYIMEYSLSVLQQNIITEKNRAEGVENSINQHVLNNAFIINFPKFAISFPSTNKMAFDANPQLCYNGKRLKVFAASDAVEGVFTLDTTSGANAIAYISTSYLNSLEPSAEIGLANITVQNWTTDMNLKDKVVLCQSTPSVYAGTGGYSTEVGVFAPFIMEYSLQQLVNTEKNRAEGVEQTLSQAISSISGIKDSYKLCYSKSLDIIKPFLAKYRAKNSDVTIVVNGDSISEHPQDYGTSIDYKTLPPLLARYNYTSLLFKELAWNGQKYRRADGTSEDTGYIFTETGEWNTANSRETLLNDWDDSDNTTGTGFRGGFTRYSNMSGANSVSFEIPEDAWSFNFIYRKDIHGGLMNVTVTGGNNKLQVFDGTNWIEANGYQFNTLQTADYANGVGNTMYQARLKFRTFDKNGTLNTRGTVKTVTISKVDNASRLCYWGVEWSPAEFMFTIINSSRGSQNLTEMQQTIKTELYDRNADLFIFQVPLINMGTVPSLSSVTPENHLSAVNSFLTDVKSDANNWLKYQCVMMLPNIYSYAKCWYDGTNEYKLVYNQIAKKMLSTRDYYDIFSENFFDSNEIGFVNTFNAFMAEILNYFPTYAQGLAASSPTGDTFTVDGTHPNHRGSDTFFKYIKPLFLN